MVPFLERPKVSQYFDHYVGRTCPLVMPWTAPPLECTLGIGQMKCRSLVDLRGAHRKAGMRSDVLTCRGISNRLRAALGDFERKGIERENKRGTRIGAVKLDGARFQ